MIRKLFILLPLLLLFHSALYADNGYRLWQRYDLIQDAPLLRQYRQTLTQLVAETPTPTPTLTVARNELQSGLSGLLGTPLSLSDKTTQKGALIVGTPSQSALIRSLKLDEQLKQLGEEGYLILSTTIKGKKATVITANTDIGVLYGSFHFLRLLQTHQPIQSLTISSAPKVKHRVLNHWDNLDRTVERGYAGFSLWDWHRLPDYIDQRYLDYARANASVGINGTVLTNVNANALVLTEPYLQKAAALADAFRPYGLKVYLTARFSAPIEIGGLATADPLDAEVQAWWKQKAAEIYRHIPDFGGFLVKADSEGQPGPHNYKRTHAEGANMLADALAPWGGIVMWRAFVYSEHTPDDRAKQAYNEFHPLDGKFRNNVLLQVKNGAIDFQPREPFHPLFGAMPQTPLMMEFQITQEYLGQGTHLAYLAPLFREVLKSDTYAQGPGSTVAKVVDGSLNNHSLSGMAGVANIGTDLNWTGHLFGQSNWYAFGRLAWDHTLTADAIATEWAGMTFGNSPQLLNPIRHIMLSSHEAVVNYMTPLGLHHIMAWSHHYGPGPWIKDKHRADWTSVYYHQADKEGIGFDRTESGSNAVAQYQPPVSEKFGDISSCPEKYLLWFHHVPWEHRLQSGNTLWEELALKYQSGVDTVRQMQASWNSLEQLVDPVRFKHVKSLLAVQEKEARWWKDACLLYFQQFSGKPLPTAVEQPSQTLEYFLTIDPKFVPGN